MEGFSGEMVLLLTLLIVYSYEVYFLSSYDNN